jgi:hypothetical protein
MDNGFKFTKKFNLVLKLYKLYVFFPLIFFQYNFGIIFFLLIYNHLFKRGERGR